MWDDEEFERIYFVTERDQKSQTDQKKLNDFSRKEFYIFSLNHLTRVVVSNRETATLL